MAIDPFVKERENIWLIARNLLKNDGVSYEADDVLNLCIFLAGDALPPDNNKLPDMDDDDEIDDGDEDGTEEEEEAAE